MSETEEGQGGDQAAERLDRPLACWHESRHSARTDRMVSLSELGGFIETDRPLPSGAEVFLELHLGHASNAAKGEIDGLVVNNGGHPVGTTGFEVQFIDLDDAVRTWIRRHIGADPQATAVTVDIPTRELAEAARARGDVPEGFEVAPSLEDEPTRSSEGFAIEQPNTLEYSESDSAPSRPAPGTMLGHSSSPHETTQRMYAAPGPKTGDEAPKPLPVSQAPGLADGSGSAPSAPAQAVPLPAPGSGPAPVSALNTPAPAAPGSGPAPAAAPAPVKPAGSGPVVSSPKQALDIAAAIEEISAPSAASPAPSAADRPSERLPAAPAGDAFDEHEIDETRPFSVAPAPKNIPAPLPIKVVDAEDVPDEGFDVEFSIDDGAPVEDSGPLENWASTMPAPSQEVSSPNVVTTEISPPSAARLSSPDDNLAGPNPAAPGPPAVPPTDPGAELASIAVDLSDEDATETGAPTLQLEQALFGDLSAEADEGRARPLSSMMDQEPEPASSGSDVSATDLEAAFLSPDAVPPSPEEPITPAASAEPSAASTSDEADDGLPAIELDAIAVESAEDASDGSDNVSTLELPAGGANPDHAAALRRPVFAPPAIPSPALTSGPSDGGDKPLGTPAAQLLGAMPSSPGSVPKDAIQQTQPFGVDASEIRRHLSADAPASGPTPAAASLGEPPTPPMGTPSPAAGKPAAPAPAARTPSSAATSSPASSSAAPAPAAGGLPTDNPARRTLQFSAAAVQAELQRTSAAGAAGRGSTDPQFPAVTKPPAGLNPDASRPVAPAPSAGPAPQRTPTDQQFPAVSVPAGLPRAATLMEPEDVVEVNSTSQLVRVATDEHGDIQSIQSAVGPVVTGTPEEAPALKLEVPDAAGGQSAVTVDTSLFAEPKKELNPFDEWSVLEKKNEDELPVVMGTDSANTTKESWVAAARPPGLKPEGED